MRTIHLLGTLLPALCCAAPSNVPTGMLGAVSALGGIVKVGPLAIPGLSISPAIAPLNGAAGVAKQVLAHFMVGNTISYSIDDWTKAITLAHSKGIDGFMLNMGADPWQPARMSDAYNAAAATGTGFKLCLSFDMSSFPCNSPGDAQTIRNLISQFATSPSYFLQDGKALVSTFAGDACTFGQGNVNDGWVSAVGHSGPVHFMPAWFSNPSSFGQYPVIDGAMNWNSGWPMGDSDINYDTDRQWTSALGSKDYMAAVSPWFFTHYGPDSYNKNFIYRGDDWLFAKRWEQLVENRDSIALAQILTWNDYGESHYVGPIAGTQPNSQAWTDGFEHVGWLDLINYYATAFKTGIYPVVPQDRVFMWGRLYPAAASAPDSVGRPDGWQYTTDTLWAVFLLREPALMTLTCGEQSTTVSGVAGHQKMSLPLKGPCGAQATMMRNGVQVLNVKPNGFNFQENPPHYNFNAFVAT